MKSAVLIIIILLTGCLSWCSAEITTEPISIQVVVTNETGGGNPAGDAEVILTVYRDGEPVDRKEGRSDENGVCLFESVPTGQGMAVVANAKNQEMMFGSRPMSLEHAHEKMYQMHVSVYDVSSDTSVLSIGTHHFVIRVDPQGIFVDEYLQIINSSDKAVTSTEKTPDGRPIILNVYLPAGFKDVKCSKYFEEHALVITEEGFIDTMAVPPGRHDAVFTYTLEPESTTLSIAKKVGLPTKDFMVFSQLSGASIEGLNEPLGQMKLNNGNPADYYSSVSLDRGSEVNFKIIGLSAPQRQDDLWIMFGIVFGAIVLVGVVRMIMQKKRQPSNSV
ncbi:MAG: hypothetical protein ACYS72_05550 [Planctomycetota bacterium]|jgi:hypothetical protein